MKETNYPVLYIIGNVIAIDFSNRFPYLISNKKDLQNEKRKRNNDSIIATFRKPTSSTAPVK